MGGYIRIFCIDGFFEVNLSDGRAPPGGNKGIGEGEGMGKVRGR